MKKQVYNPFLPLDVCIPDGEPHVFGDRVYLFGSHEEDGGDKFCSLGYEFFSAPVKDLSDWTSRGINYEPSDDPSYGEKYRYMYAPDVVRGNDGKYYLYYAMSGDCFTGPIHVAVCDTPDGRYKYYGEVRNKDGSTFTRKITFDPAVMNDGGTIRLYYGWALAVDKDKLSDTPEFKAKILDVQAWMFVKSREEISCERDGIMGAFTVTLGDDMLTVTSEPKRIVPGQFDSEGTDFEGHAFFEASSIRKIGESYFFIYSSEHQHELCYATSRYPDCDFRYRGIIVSNGDIGYNGRKANERLAATGNNHGSIENIGGQWYVFYHRHTHNTSFSRKACAEKITLFSGGDISQAEMTSCGLNVGALDANGKYTAVICCNLTNGNMPHIDPQNGKISVPYITHASDCHYIADIADGTVIGYKYFVFNGKTTLKLTLRGGGGTVGVKVGDVEIKKTIGISPEWRDISFSIDVKGVLSLYIVYEGEGKMDLRELDFVFPKD